MAKININNTEKTIEAIYQVSSRFEDPAILLARTRARRWLFGIGLAQEKTPFR